MKKSLDRLLALAERTEELAVSIAEAVAPAAQPVGLNDQELELLMGFIRTLTTMTEQQYRQAHPREYERLERLLFTEEEMAARRSRKVSGLRLADRPLLRRSA